MGAKQQCVKLPHDLMESLKKGTMAILGTFSEKGVPYTTPIQCIYPKNDESILLTVHKEHEAYTNMVWQKKVSLCFLDENNVTYNAMGRAGVVRAPSLVHPMMNVIRVDIIELSDNNMIKQENYSLFSITSGIKWQPISGDAEFLLEALKDELKDLSTIL